MLNADALDDQLLRDSYVSTLDQRERDYFVYLPQGYTQNPTKHWPVLFFLHGNGERGNGKDELDFVLHHGPLYEAWVQKRNLPFIIVAPQLPMFSQDQLDLDYIENRNFSDIPHRLKRGVPVRPDEIISQNEMLGQLAQNPEDEPLVMPDGWDLIEEDLIEIFTQTLKKYRTDKTRVYLSGISYGGFGTWYMASRHPKIFSAIAPVVAWGHPELMAPIASHQIPIWVFAAGRDDAIELPYFYTGLNKLEALGHKDVRFTIHQDMGHDAWRRIYAGEDIYLWLLSHQH